MRILLCLCLVLLLFSIGCKQNQPSSAVVITEEDKKSSLSLQNGRIVFMDEKLKEQIRFVEKPELSRDKDLGNLVFNGRMQTAIDENIHLDIKYLFIDKEGREEQTNWYPLILKRNEPKMVTFRSLSPEAERFNLFIRFSK